MAEEARFVRIRKHFDWALHCLLLDCWPNWEHDWFLAIREDSMPQEATAVLSKYFWIAILLRLMLIVDQMEKMVGFLPLETTPCPREWGWQHTPMFGRLTAQTYNTDSQHRLTAQAHITHLCLADSRPKKCSSRVWENNSEQQITSFLSLETTPWPREWGHTMVGICLYCVVCWKYRHVVQVFIYYFTKCT